jgi:putative ABC transport system permease protein
MRSLLTSLGIIIGVGAVIAMMAIGAGAKFQVEQAFAAMGTNLLIVQPGSSVSSGVRGGYGSMPTLTYDDLAAVRTEVPSVRTAAPVLRSNQSLICEDANWTTSVTGTTPEYFDIRDWPMESGPGITQQDIEAKTKVVVLGKTVVGKLFGSNVDPVGQSVRVGQIPFSVPRASRARVRTLTMPRSFLRRPLRRRSREG